MSFVPVFLSDSTGDLGLNCQCHSAKAKGQESGGHSRLKRKYISRPVKGCKWFVAGPGGAELESLPFLDANGLQNPPLVVIKVA